MRLEIRVDGMNSMIDSTDPETLGRWMVEIFSRYPNMNPGTFVQVQANPSFIPDPTSPHGGRADWIQDTRYLDIGVARTPRELLNLLTVWLDKYETRDD